MYKLIKFNLYGVQQNHVQKDNSDGSFTSFPALEDNTDYQAYLKWVAEGNTPTPADEGTQ
jgi:hypothetical protein